MKTDDLVHDIESIPILPAEVAGESLPKPTVVGPLRIGIAPPIQSISRDARNDRRSKFAFDVWTDEEVETIQEWAQSAQAAGLIEHFEFLPSMIIEQDKDNVLESCQKAARIRQLDAILVARVGTTYKVTPNLLSLLDLALVPALVVPTSEYQSTAVLEGAVLDAKTGYPYALGSAESVYSRRAASLQADPAAYQRIARVRGVKNLAERIVAPYANQR